MAKWFSLIAFIVAAGAAYLLFESQGLVENLQKKGAEIKTDLDSTKGALRKKTDELTAVTADLAKEKTAKETALAEAASKKEEADKANGELNSIRQALVDAGIKDAADLKTGLGALKETIAKLSADSKAAEEKIAAATKDKEEAVAKAAEAEKKANELDIAMKTLTTAKDELDKKSVAQGKVIDKYKNNIMEKGVHGRVLAVNSGWGFAVVSVGDKQGAAQGKTLVVSRGGQAIGKLRISNIESNQSIADIVTGSFVGGSYVQPGDDVVYTGDEKVKLDDAGAVGSPALPVH